MSEGKFPGTRFDVIAVCASAGGLHALHVLLAGFPRDLPAAVLVAQHLAPTHRSYFASLLDRPGGIRVREAGQGCPAQPGLALVAPPDYHMRLTSAFTLDLSQGEKVAYARPSADILLESVASVCGPRAIGVVLTGLGRDGARGAQAIHQAGGVVLAQDPESAEYAPMPRAAALSGAVDYVLPLEHIAERILLLLEGLPE